MIKPFTSDEEFHQWCAEHQDDGFFVGYVRGYPPKTPGSSTYIPRMHRASCTHATTRAHENYVGRLYEKSGSTDRRALIEYFTPAGLQYCKHCHPDAAYTKMGDDPEVQRLTDSYSAVLEGERMEIYYVFGDGGVTM